MKTIVLVHQVFDRDAVGINKDVAIVEVLSGIMISGEELVAIPSETTKLTKPFFIRVEGIEKNGEVLKRAGVKEIVGILITNRVGRILRERYLLLNKETYEKEDVDEEDIQKVLLKPRLRFTLD